MEGRAAAASSNAAAAREDSKAEAVPPARRRLKIFRFSENKVGGVSSNVQLIVEFHELEPGRGHVA